ncbi:MAG: hypothetical protein Q8N44_18300, partial [Rubrivivax sp.]|nr:hypothetical protein [Rubrivivax sp.]
MINPQLQPFLVDWAAAWASLAAAATPAQRCAHFEIVAAQMRQPTPAGVDTEERHVAVPGTDRQVRVRLFRPLGSAPQPALIYMHGGAWMQGSP